MRIFAGGVVTETNTFSPIPTGIDDFVVSKGASVASDGSFDLERIWGDVARESGHEFIRGVMAWAMPAGVTAKFAYEMIRDQLLGDIKSALPVDVVLLMLHGSMVAIGYDDCEQDIVDRVRELVGPDVVVGVELDLHCNVQQRFIETVDAVISYKEYPHTDVNQRARELFDICTGTAAGEITPSMSLYDCQMLGMYPTTREPLRGLINELILAESQKDVLSLSILHGFPFADVPHASAKVLAVTNGNQQLTQTLAERFGRRLYEMRSTIGFESLSQPMESALRAATQSLETPVVVADQSDNTGGGAPGDSTFVLRWLMSNHIGDVGVAIFYDPEVVRLARNAGIGATLRFRLGGKLGPTSGDPIDLDATVGSIRDDYRHQFPQATGEQIYFRVGNVVALHSQGIHIIVGSERCQCMTPTIFSDLGIEPRDLSVIVVKSYQHFYAGFAPLAKRVIYMASPGAVPPDPRLLPYKKVNVTNMYPWSSPA